MHNGLTVAVAEVCCEALLVVRYDSPPYPRATRGFLDVAACGVFFLGRRRRRRRILGAPSGSLLRRETVGLLGIGVTPFAFPGIERVRKWSAVGR